MTRIYPDSLDPQVHQWCVSPDYTLYYILAHFSLPYVYVLSALSPLIARAGTLCKLRTDRALEREMHQHCPVMERMWKQKVGRGQDLCFHLLFTPAGAESKPSLSCSLATFLSEARGASLDKGAVDGT